MVCGRCNTYFCWICGERLNTRLPYLHYQNPESKCFNKLYYGLIGDEDDDEDDDDDDYNAVYLDLDSEDDDFYEEYWNDADDFQLNE